MTMLYPSDVLNTFPFTGHYTLKGFDYDDEHDFVVGHIKRTPLHSSELSLRSLECDSSTRYDMSPNDNEVDNKGEPPRSILKKSASADAAMICRWKSNLLTICTKGSQSLENLDGVSQESPLSRSSSSASSPRSPQKNVTFADDNNLKLVEVRNYVPSNDKISLWANFQGIQTDKCEKEALLLQTVKHRRNPVELTLCFTEPGASSDFMERFKHRCVALEKCAVRDRTIAGIILVKNMEYHKSVTVRYTTDKWKTSCDTEAQYVPNSNDGLTDRFTFNLTLPRSSGELDFAICYKTSHNEFWDNNYNRNYKVQDALQLSKSEAEKQI